jgi:hypothetical protein
MSQSSVFQNIRTYFLFASEWMGTLIYIFFIPDFYTVKAAGPNM